MPVDTDLRRVAGLAGMAAPIVFAVAVAFITWASHDFMRDLGWSLFDHGESAWPSGLAQGPHGWAQIANYAVTGLLILMLVAGMRVELRSVRRGRLATILLALLALGFILAAFPEDGPPFEEPHTWAGRVHGAGFLALILMSLAAPLAMAAALRKSERWRGYARLSAAAGLVAFFFIFVLVFALERATTLGVYGFFAVTLGWVALLGHRLRRLSGA